MHKVVGACVTVAALHGSGFADCGPNPPPEVESRQAAAVFVGRVAAESRQGDWHIYEFEAEFAWKGVSGRRVLVLSDDPGCARGCHFEVGRSYLVYAHSGPDGLVAHDCSRTAELAAAGEDLAALGRPPAVFLIEPAASRWPPAVVFALGLTVGGVASAGGWYAWSRRARRCR